MKKLLLVISLSLLSPVQATSLPKKALRTLTNVLFYLIASSDASEKTTSQAQDLIKKVDPSKELLAVRKFNKFGKFLFGDHNTITIPYLNYLIVDNEGMDSLSEESRKFLLGRCMMTLRHQHKYLIYKYAIPYAIKQLYCKITTKTERASLPKLFEALLDRAQADAIYVPNDQHNPLPIKRFDFDSWKLIEEKWDQTKNPRDQIMKQKNAAIFAVQKDAPYSFACLYTLGIFSGYCKRGIEYELDVRATELCDGNKGAIEYFEHLKQGSAKNPWGRFGFVCSGLLAGYLGADEKNKPSFSKKLLTSWAKLVNYTKQSIYWLPGKNSIFNWIPIFGNFDGGHPMTQDRINNLEDKSDITFQNLLTSLVS